MSLCPSLFSGGGGEVCFLHSQSLEDESVVDCGWIMM